MKHSFTLVSVWKIVPLNTCTVRQIIFGTSATLCLHPIKNFPTLQIIMLFQKSASWVWHFILFTKTLMNSRTFKETLCGLDSIKTKYAEISKWTDKPLITSGEWSKWGTSWKCWTHFKDKKLVCKLYKYNSWNVYFHDFRDGSQMKYSYIIGQSA